MPTNASTEQGSPHWTKRLGYRHLTMTVAVLLVAIPAVVLFPGADHVSDGLRVGVTPWALVVFAGVAVAAAALKGISGFGYSLLVTPVAALVIDPALAVIVLAIPPLMLNLFQVGETGTGLRYARQNWPLIAAGLVGSALGVYLLSTKPDTAVLSVLVAVILLAYIGYQLTHRFAAVAQAGHPAWLGVVGVVQGFLLGAVNLGPILPAYLHTFERNANRYIGGMSLFFTLVIGERVIQMSAQGILTDYRLWLGSAIALITLAGLAIGTAIRRTCQINKGRLDAIITALLLATAVSLLWKALPQLW